MIKLTPSTVQRRHMNPGKPTCQVVRASIEFVGKQGHLLAPGICADTRSITK